MTLEDYAKGDLNGGILSEDERASGHYVENSYTLDEVRLVQLWAGPMKGKWVMMRGTGLSAQPVKFRVVNSAGEPVRETGNVIVSKTSMSDRAANYQETKRTTAAADAQGEKVDSEIELIEQGAEAAVKKAAEDAESGEAPPPDFTKLDIKLLAASEKMGLGATTVTQERMSRVALAIRRAGIANGTSPDEIETQTLKAWEDILAIQVSTKKAADRVKAQKLKELEQMGDSVLVPEHLKKLLTDPAPVPKPKPIKFKPKEKVAPDPTEYEVSP